MNPTEAKVPAMNLPPQHFEVWKQFFDRIMETPADAAVYYAASDYLEENGHPVAALTMLDHARWVTLNPTAWLLLDLPRLTYSIASDFERNAKRLQPPPYTVGQTLEREFFMYGGLDTQYGTVTKVNHRSLWIQPIPLKRLDGTRHNAHSRFDIVLRRTKWREDYLATRPERLADTKYVLRIRSGWKWQ